MREKKWRKGDPLTHYPLLLVPYVSKNKEGPTHLLGNEFLEEEQGNIETSALIDFLWVLLRYKCSVDGTEQLVPNWTGFNYMIEGNVAQETHSITYLPAIDQSPTKMETVLEILTQSKYKAEKIGLKETDVVLDQAIYAKAVEILLNPIHADLKKFIVLRMGAFHTSCIFLAVIGKRFADAGLRDLIVEANLLGLYFGP